MLLKSLRFVNKYGFASQPLLTTALLGRSSVGKSSLFNKLQNGENVAITSKQKNITRDRMEAYSELFQVPVRFVDTAGIENVALQKLSSPLQQKMLIQTLNALEYSDLALFVIDAKTGLLPIDYQIAAWLRKTLKISQPTNIMVGELKDLSLKSNIKDVILVANKCENDQVYEGNLQESLKRLGLGEPVYVSAADGTGFQDLLQRINKFIPQSSFEQFEQIKLDRKLKYLKLKEKCKQEVLEQLGSKDIELDIKQWEKEFDQANPNPQENSDLDDDDIQNQVYSGSVIQEKTGVSSENIQRRNAIMLAIMGRPNVGKSTLVNTLLDCNSLILNLIADRMIADETAGTTRDPISSQWIFKGQKIQLVDTAGLFPKNKKELDELDLQIQSKTRYIMRYAHVIVVLVDSLGALREMDLDLLQEISQEGRALILGVNKWDMVEKQYQPKILKFLNRQLAENLGEIPKCTMIPISAEKNIHIDQLSDKVITIYNRWNTRISTGLLNDWLNKFKKIQSLPSEDGDKLKIRFIAQIKVRPPTFALFINEGSLFKKNYLRFLRRKLSQEFDIEGVPIRIVLRDISYSKEKKKLEKQHTTTVKDELLNKRKINKLAKQKLESLRSKQKAE